MATQKSEQLQKLFPNTQGSSGKGHGNLLNHPPVQGRSNHSYQPWQTVHLNCHNLIHSHFSRRGNHQNKELTRQFQERNKTCGGGQACGCAKLPSLLWPPGDGEPPGQWKEVSTRINVWPDDKPAFGSKRATVPSHWAQTLLLGTVLSPAVRLAFQTRTCVQQQLAGDHWPKLKHHHSTTPSWVWYLVVVHMTSLRELKFVGGYFFSLFEKWHFYIGSVIPELRMTNCSSPFLEKRKYRSILIRYILLLIDSSLVKSYIKKILKGTVFSYSSEVMSSTGKALASSHAFSGILHFPCLHHSLGTPIHLMPHRNHSMK